MTQYGIARCRHVFAVRHTAHPPAQPRGERLLSCVLVCLPENNCPDWIRQELSDQFSWFGQHLPIPGRIARHFKRRDTIWGICWFDPQAREAVSRARYCAWLLEEGGLPVRAITVSGQREVIWRDAHQIVTKPSADLPRAFS